MRTAPQPPYRVRFYFCFRSPYSWFAVHRLAQVLEGLPVALELVPNWEPNPDLRAALRERNVIGHYAPWHPFKRRYMFQDVRRLAAGYGLRLTWPIDRDPDWARPHLAFLYARAQGVAERFLHAVFAARFERGGDVTDAAELCALGASCGLDGDALLAALTDGRYDAEVLRLFEQAALDQVFGWPFFVLGIERFWGNDRLEALARRIRQLAAEARRAVATA